MILENIELGTIIEGKWLKHQYKLLKLLGKGGIGRVYMAIDLGTQDIYAIKLANDIQSITKESEVLKRFQGIELFPRFREVDDCIIELKKYFFIVMEYIQGESLNETFAVRGLSHKEILGMGLIIGKTFRVLHRKDLVFGDLKLENLMIDKKNRILRIIDFGGVTPMGSSVKEYTQIYDRASWDAGIRRADQQYDLFSLNMLIVNMLLQNTVQLMDYDLEKLIKKLSEKKIPMKLEVVIACGFKQLMSFENYLYQLEDIYSKYEYSGESYAKTKFNTVLNCILAGSLLAFVGLLAACGEKVFNF